MASLIKDEVVVTNLGVTANEWQKIAHREANIYSVGMGLVSPTALGLALSLPGMKVIALDGDGSLLLDLSVLSTISRMNAENLTVIALDNKSYESIGSSPTHTRYKANLEAIARGSGISKAATVRDTQVFTRAFTEALSTAGPWFINAEIEEGKITSPPKIMYGRYNTFLFQNFLRSKGLAFERRPFTADSGYMKEVK